MKSEKSQKTQITVQITVNAPIRKVWQVWTTADDILQWNTPSADWHTTRAEIDFREKGEFLFRMEAKDGSTGFDYSGMYDRIINHEHIEHTGHDGRQAIIKFIPESGAIRITETFDVDEATPIELQNDFCQGVLNSFKRYTENDTSK